MNISVTMNFESIVDLSDFINRLHPVGTSETFVETSKSALMNVQPSADPVDSSPASPVSLQESVEIESLQLKPQKAKKLKQPDAKKPKELLAQQIDCSADAPSLDDVRASLSAYNSKFGFLSLKNFLKNKFGVESLKEIPFDKYAEVISSAKKEME